MQRQLEKLRERLAESTKVIASNQEVREREREKIVKGKWI
jgi:hypothetical protein